MKHLRFCLNSSPGFFQNEWMMSWLACHWHVEQFCDYFPWGKFWRSKQTILKRGRNEAGGTATLLPVSRNRAVSVNSRPVRLFLVEKLENEELLKVGRSSEIKNKWLWILAWKLMGKFHDKMFPVLLRSAKLFGCRIKFPGSCWNVQNY